MRGAPTRRDPEQIDARHGVRRAGRGGRDAVRGAAPRRARRGQHPLHPAGRRRGAVAHHAAAARRAAAGAPVRAGVVGAGGGRRAAGRDGQLARALDRRHDRRRAERGRQPQSAAAPVAVPADRGLRVPLGLPHRRARRARTARSTGSACRGSTRRASSGACSTARPGSSASAPFGDQPSDRAALRRRHERAGDDLEDADGLGGRARRADDGPVRDGGHGHAAHPAARRRRRRPHARPHGRVHRRPGRDRARRASRSSTTGATAGDVDARRRRPPRAPTRAAAGQTVRLVPTCRSASRATASRARAHACRRASGRTARCPGPRGSPPRRTWTTPRRGSTRPGASGADWLGTAHGIPDHRLRDPLQRSALTIKGLTYMPTGATVAALTTSLPETPGGERNWDYRYTWMRDTTFTLQALHCLNLDWEADEFMQFVADLEANDDGALQIMYGIDGRRDLTESTRDDLSGYAGARPVRIGNGAFDQRQNDVFGAVLDSILLHTRQERTPAAAAVADRPGAGGVRDRRLAEPGPGDLGGARRAAALRVVEADVLGRARPRGEARRDPRRRSSSQAEWAGDGGGDPRRHPRQGRRRARRARASTTTPTRSTRRRCSRRSSASCRATTSGCARPC